MSNDQMPFMKKLFFVLSAFFFTAASCDRDHTTTNKCSIPAVVKNLSGLDGCSYAFQLNDGTIIEPYRMLYCGTPPLPKEITEDPLYGFSWIDGKKVKISFTEIDSIVSTCMKGKIAKITCLQDLEPDKTCIEVLINKIKSEDVRNPPAKIFQYTFYGSTVYFVPQYCCDFPSVLYDENCNAICQPDGGFSGKGDGNCIDFFQERKNEKLVWEDDRVSGK